MVTFVRRKLMSYIHLYAFLENPKNHGRLSKKPEKKSRICLFSLTRGIIFHFLRIIASKNCLDLETYSFLTLILYCNNVYIKTGNRRRVIYCKYISK